MQPAVPAIKHHLPAHLIVLFDSLANVDFMSLTKRLLKEKVEVLKSAVAAELAKRSDSSRLPDSASRDRPLHRVVTPEPPKTVPKPVRNADRPSDRVREVDKGQPTRQQPATKNSGLKSSAAPAPPKFSDLIRLAASSDRHEDSDESDPSQPARNMNAYRRPSPDSRRRLPENKAHNENRARNEPRSRPPDDQRPSSRPGPENRAEQRVEPSGSSAQARGRSDGYENRSRRAAYSRPLPPGRTPVNANSSTRNGRDQRADQRHQGQGDIGNAGDREEEAQDRDRRDEKKVSAKARKKNEEERQLEMRKQRIRDEEARVKLRNDVLAGKNSSADLKTLVTKSQGSTVLNCGRPQAPSDSHARRDRPPDRSTQRPANRNDQRQGAAHSLRDSYDRFRPTDRDQYRQRPSDRYYNDYDDEDEEEMDDFIDDEDGNFVNDGEVPDVSQHIREIFGYDKRKYADFDDDDIEESSYAQVQKEEMRSAKIGRKEDLEDMKMELMKKKEKRRLMDR